MIVDWEAGSVDVREPNFPLMLKVGSYNAPPITSHNCQVI